MSSRRRGLLAKVLVGGVVAGAGYLAYKHLVKPAIAAPPPVPVRPAYAPPRAVPPPQAPPATPFVNVGPDLPPTYIAPQDAPGAVPIYLDPGGGRDPGYVINPNLEGPLPGDPGEAPYDAPGEAPLYY